MGLERETKTSQHFQVKELIFYPIGDGCPWRVLGREATWSDTGVHKDLSGSSLVDRAAGSEA